MTSLRARLGAAADAFGATASTMAVVLIATVAIARAGDRDPPRRGEAGVETGTDRH
ncbi:MAG: hypothetical protein KDK70_18905 [Myxococcales bacterium]|nr:hypothetical protein [Myxococcales bacterium]